jgi:hypothetical protein
MERDSTVAAGECFLFRNARTSRIFECKSSRPDGTLEFYHARSGITLRMSGQAFAELVAAGDAVRVSLPGGQGHTSPLCSAAWDRSVSGDPFRKSAAAGLNPFGDGVPKIRERIEVRPGRLFVFSDAGSPGLYACDCVVAGRILVFMNTMTRCVRAIGLDKFGAMLRRGEAKPADGFDDVLAAIVRYRRQDSGGRDIMLRLKFPAVAAKRRPKPTSPGPDPDERVRRQGSIPLFRHALRPTRH